MQLELRQCEDEEKRRELKERLKEYDEVSINVIIYRPVDHSLHDLAHEGGFLFTVYASNFTELTT